MGTLTYLGHSGWMIKCDSLIIVIDPFLEGNPTARIEPSEIKADYLIVTHAHSDHLGDAIAMARSSGGTIISNFEIAKYCENQGAKTHAMHIGGAHHFSFGRVKLTPAWHGSSFPDRTYGGTPAGCLITLGKKTIYHAGDTGLFLDMKLIGEMNRIDIALLPIGDNFTMGIDDAVKAVQFLKPRLVIPMHYNTFDVIKASPEEFVSKVKKLKMKAQVIEIGGSIEF